MLPPVDIQLSAAGAVDGSELRMRHGIADEEICLVTVSRLVSHYMKAQRIRRMIQVAGQLADEFPLRFVVVGEGTSRLQVESLGGEVNARYGRNVVRFSGPQVDPRPPLLQPQTAPQAGEIR
jgi:hypothetical protein